MTSVSLNRKLKPLLTLKSGSSLTPMRVPHDFQRRGVEWLVSHGGAGVFAKPGAGKTAITLRALLALKQAKVMRRTLIVAPIRPMYKVWPTEAAEWSGTEWDALQSLRINVLHGKNKEQAAMEDADISIINFEGLKWLFEDGLYKRFKEMRVDTFVVDECFIGTTLITTPDGPKEIQLLKVGDLVDTCIGPKRVFKAYKRKPIGPLVQIRFSNGKEITCTADHCFYTETGWLPAKYLKGRRVLANAEVSDLSKQLFSDSLEISKLPFSADLFQILRNEVESYATFSGCLASKNGPVSQKEVYGETSLEQGDSLAGRSKEETFRSEEEFRVAGLEWQKRWQRNRNVKSRKVGQTGITEGFYFRLSDRIGWKASWLSYQLQSRFWRSQNKISNRSGREQSQLSNKESAGQKERIKNRGIWVESVKNIKLGSVPFIWNLEIEECPHFEVEGVALVHNSSKFKNQRTRRFKMLKQVLPKFARRWIQTGTPNPNGYMNLFSQCYIIDLGNALGRYITHYRFKYFNPLDREGWQWCLKPGAEKLIQAAIAPYIFHLEPGDYEEIPIKQNVVRVDLPEDVEEIYKEMKKELIVELTKDKYVTAANIGAAYMKCAQIANGGIYYKEFSSEEGEQLAVKGKKVWTNLHEAKIDAVEEIVDELNGSPCIVVYDFQHDLDRLKIRFKTTLERRVAHIGRGVSINESNQIIDDWNADKIEILLVQATSISHGLNMQYGSAQDIIWHSLTYDLEVFEQLNARLARQGTQHDQIFVHMIVAKETVDELKLRALRSKDKTQRGFLAALKEYAAERSIVASDSKPRRKRR